MSETDGPRVELMGEEKERADHLCKEAERSLLDIAEIVFRALDIDEDRTQLRLVLKPGNTVVAIFRAGTGGPCLGVLENPPGICRPCNPGE